MGYNYTVHVTEVNQGGRPAIVTRASIVAVGRELGMAALSVAAVAGRLGVSPAALYRHVENRWHLERLVGESLLADLSLDAAVGPGVPNDLETQLLRFGRVLHDFAAARPGLADYLLTLFPRGETGLRLMETEAAALRARGLTDDAAVAASNAVASMAFALVAAEERRRDAAAGDHDGGFAVELQAATDRFEAQPWLAAVVPALPEVSGEDYGRLLLATFVRGLVATLGAEPGAATSDSIVADLSGRLVRAGEPPIDPHPRTTPNPLEG